MLRVRSCELRTSTLEQNRLMSTSAATENDRWGRGEAVPPNNRASACSSSCLRAQVRQRKVRIRTYERVSPDSPASYLRAPSRAFLAQLLKSRAISLFTLADFSGSCVQSLSAAGELKLTPASSERLTLLTVPTGRHSAGKEKLST